MSPRPKKPTNAQVIRDVQAIRRMQRVLGEYATLEEAAIHLIGLGLDLLEEDVKELGTPRRDPGDPVLNALMGRPRK